MNSATHPLARGTDFESLKDLKNACAEFAVKEIFEFKTVRATRKRYEILCKSVECPWRIYASAVMNTSLFRIKSCTLEHNCFGINHRGHDNVTQAYIAKMIRSKLSAQPDYRPIDIVKDVQTELGVSVTYQKAFRAKMQAFVDINGTHEDAYKHLPQYCKDLENANPNSVIVLENTDENKFKRLFISYGASATGFAHCRPLLGLDGTHLKAKYQGIPSSFLD
jgi:hypothetical protein